MKNVRVWFEKTGPARYVSHLDLARCMSRALRLSGLPIWYTEGFNPRVYMTYAMPLSLGVRGERECVDIRLTEDADLKMIPGLLNDRLPEGVRVLCAAEPVRKLEEIAFADYEIRFETEDSAALGRSLESLLSQENILVTKKSKKGDREVDIKPYFRDMDAQRPDDSHLILSVRLPCSVSGSVNPGLILDALARFSGEAPYAQITRKRLLIEDFTEIR